MRRLALIGGWIVVVLLTTALTWQIVSAADDRVSQRPSSPLNVAAPLLAASDESSTTPQTTTALATSTTISQSPNTTIPGATTSTSASISVPASTTTSLASEWAVKTISTSGGNVVVKYRPEEVVLQAASPAAGFRVEVDKAGPPEVRVEFESETSSVEVRVEWKDGALDIEISEDD